MLTVILDWTYLILTTFALGFGFGKVTEKVTGYRIKTLDALLMAGMVLSTVYAQAFSLFGGVGALANAILSAGCLLLFLCLGKEMGRYLAQCFRKASRKRKWALGVLFVLWAYLTCQGYMHYDTDLYHAQSIRWIEEYGAVKGLSNLHSGYAYNSSLFCTTALYSLKFLLGRSLHTINGWIAFLLTMAVLDLGKAWKRKKLLLSDYASLASIYYLTLIADEVVSPASDYTAMCLIFYIIVKWLRQLENTQETDDVAPYALLCIAGVYAMTLKLTAGLILLLTIRPAYLLCKKKRGGQIAFYLLCGILTALPWLVRTVVLSGWLLYPFTALDLFSVDWKQPAWEVEKDAAGIKTWGRAIYNEAKVDTPVREWFGNWFRTTLSTTEKLLVAGNIAVLFAMLPTAGVILLKKLRAHFDFVLVMATLLSSYVFWQLSAPLIRYGYAYVLLNVALFGGWILQRLKQDRPLQALFACYGVYKAYVVGLYMYVGLANAFLVWQQDYNLYPLYAYEVDGAVFYEPGDYTDRTGYDPFPALPKKVTNFALRGEELSDGFVRQNKPPKKKKKTTAQ